MPHDAEPLAADQPDRYREALSAFVAPVAYHADAVARDPEVIRVAEAVYEAFGDHGADGGLTRGELASLCSKSVNPALFESRFDLFVSMGLVHRYRDKAHQQRYTIDPAGVAALLVYPRLRDANGVEEIIMLLGRTRQDLAAGELSEDELAGRLTHARRALSIVTDYLLRLVHEHPWEDLIRERSQRRSADLLLDEATELITAASARFPGLADSGKRLVGEALRYVGAVREVCDRLLEQASARHDFSMLTPEQYLSAARRGDKDHLAAPLARTVFDPATLVVTPEQVIAAIEEFRPAPPRRRAPRPPDSHTAHDPAEAARQRAARRRATIEAQAELHLQGAGEVDLTSRIRGAGWPGAAAIVVETLAAHANPDIPLRVALSTALVIDPIGRVSHVTPIALSRVPRRPVPGEDSAVADKPAEVSRA